MASPPDEHALPSTLLGSMGKKSTSSKIRQPTPPPPDTDPEPNQTRFHAPPGLDIIPKSCGAQDGGYDNGRPPAPSEASASSRPPPPPQPSTVADPGRDKKAPEKVYQLHLDDEAIKQGLSNGTLIKGKLRVATHKPSTAYVQPDGAKARNDDIIVFGRKARNRAINGDVVIVEFIHDGDAVLHTNVEDDQEEEDDPRQLRAAIGGNSSDSSDDEQVAFPGLGGARDESEDPLDELQSVSKFDGKGRGKGERRGGRKKAIVRGIVDAKEGRDRVIVCTLHPNTFSRKKGADGDPPDQADVVQEGDNVFRAVPTDSRLPWILIQVNEVTKNVLNIPGKLDRFKLWPVQIVKWNDTSHLPLGRLKGECLGQAGDVEAEEMHALIEHQLDSHDVDFDDNELDEVNDIVRHADANFEHEASKRKDLRRKRIFTIDPATARDLDDAIHVDRKGNRVEIGVHIADVAHFLKLGSIADIEARRRTTSVYLVNRVLPMLPHALCNHLCSLNPNEPKISFSAFFQLDKETGELVEDPPPWFEKTVMSSVCRLNYDEVQTMLDGYEIEPPPVYGGYTWEQIKADIELLQDVCGKVRRGRLAGGAMTITKAKMIFHTRESEDGVPTGYHLEEHSASHWIIEELMLLANRCVAKHLAFSSLSDVSVLRNHRPPDPEKAETLETMMKTNLGLDWNCRSAGTIYRCCQRVYQKYGEMLGLCVEFMTMRCGMQQAEYYRYGTEDNPPHHFALNFDYYTHFTSPIRRYPDVMVHRVLAALLTGDEASSTYQDKNDAEGQVVICNEKKSASRKCQEQLDRSMFCIYLRRQKEWFYTIGTVLGMKEDHRSGKDIVTVYCSQLGKEKKILLCTAEEVKQLEVEIATENDELLLPHSWNFQGRYSVQLLWKNPEKPEEPPLTQKLKVLSCIPIVIIPANTVPIDYQMFFVSPFHRKQENLSAEVSEAARDGIDWQDDKEEDMEVVFDARRARRS